MMGLLFTVLQNHSKDVSREFDTVRVVIYLCKLRDTPTARFVRT